MWDDLDEHDVELHEDDDQGYLVHLVPAASVEMNGYWCVVCMRYVPVEEDGVMLHDDIPHPPLMTFDEDRFPQ